MSWKSGDLPVICGQEDVLWSIRAAALVLDAPAERLMNLVRKAGLEPVGKRHEAGLGRRHMRVYRAADVIRAWDSAVRDGLVKNF